MSWPAPVYQDGTLSTAKRSGLPVLSCPIPGDKTPYILSEEWTQLLVNSSTFTPLALDTQHPEYTGYYLVEETPMRADGPLVRWNRIYAKPPSTHSEYETFAYSYIGRQLDIGGSSTLVQVRQSFRVTSRVQHDYFFCATGQTYTTPGAIPSIVGLPYVSQASYLGATYGGITMPTDVLYLAASTSPTWPTAEQYQTMVIDALSNAWGASVSNVVIYLTSTLSGGPPATSGHMAGVIDTGSSTLGGQIPAEDSRLTRWRGNMWLRQTRYVLAQ